ncbi:MAG TPA: type II toxin-antitoxin system RelE/ParE family toxin [Nitrospiria bacterium]|nr:type II toxin-antitoxin system RelE/ParE family toxin [Nitrospiria bacterium]
MVSDQILYENQWTIRVLIKDGECEVIQFIEGLDQDDRKKADRLIKFHGDNGPHPSKQKFRIIENGFFEYKPTKQVRILGFFNGQREMLLTHGCVKKKDKLNPEEMEKLRKLFEEYKERGTKV